MGKHTENEEETGDDGEKLIYGVEDTPPWHLNILFAVQMVLANLGACILMSTLISKTICANALFTARMFATTSVMSGLTTIVMTFLGVRLPIFQGPTLLGALPYLDAQDDPRWRCGQNMTQLYYGNSTGISPDENAWDEQWSKIQGSMLVAAIFETLLGVTGIIGLVARVIRPVTITTIFLLIGVYLWEIAVGLGEVHWGVAFGSLGMVILFSLYIDWVRVPVPHWSRAAGWAWTHFPLFELFPILLVIVLMWPICHVVTVLGGFTDNSTDISYKARTDIYADDIRDSPAFRFPYPGQFGPMTFDSAYVIFYIPCLLSSAIESLADYYQYALACQVPPPPRHAINRGIAIEGLGAMVSAWLGAGHPTTSYSNIMGIISMTKVGSRSVMMLAGVMMATIGVIGPLGAALVAIPTPILFGPIILAVSFLVGSAFANLISVNVAKRRNLSILGISVYLSCVLSFYLKYTDRAINTDSKLFNDVATGIFRVPFITGGVISVFLDMTLREDSVPKDKSADSDPSHSAQQNRDVTSYNSKVDDVTLYDPPFVGAWMKKHKIFRFIPFFPGPPATKEIRSGAYDSLENVNIRMTHIDS